MQDIVVKILYNHMMRKFQKSKKNGTVGQSMCIRLRVEFTTHRLLGPHFSLTSG